MDMTRTTTVLTVAVLAACDGSGGADPAGAAAPPATAAPLRATPLASGLVNPWSLAFLPDGRFLVTERPGRLRLISADGRTLSPPIAGTPAVDAAGQGGLFDVALAADFASTRRLFLSYAEPGSGAEAGRNGLAVGQCCELKVDVTVSY